MDESAIFIGLKSGDKKAFDLLYDLLYDKLCFFADAIIDDEMEAEDIAIHSLTKFWEKGPKDFEVFPQVKTFIFRTARNASLDYLKKAKVQRTHHQNLVHINSEAEESIAERAERALYKMEMLQMLADEIEKLPAQCRETFKLVVIENMPREDVAGKLNISLSTVNNHCANAKKRLRQIFSEKDLIVLLLLYGLCPN